MAPLESFWSTSSLQRYRPAILFITATAAACAILLYHDTISVPASQAPKGLHRSNARRRRHSRRAPASTDTGDQHVLTSLAFLHDPEDQARVYGRFHAETSQGLIPVDLNLQVLNALDRHVPNEERSSIAPAVEEAFLLLYVYCHIGQRSVTTDQRMQIAQFLYEMGNFTPTKVHEMITDVASEGGEMVGAWINSGIRPGNDYARHCVTDPQLLAEFSNISPASPPPSSTLLESTREPSQTDDSVQTENGLLNLLYRIAEEQSQKEGHVHRGITCNGCGTHPIRGLRYRCSNCVDYDLCETCEAQQFHPKTHIFYKIRVPRTNLGSERQDIKYPGRGIGLAQLSKGTIMTYSRQTGYKPSEIEGIHEQFKCLANVVWPEDPSPFKLAMDRKSFDQMFLPTCGKKLAPMNLIYDRIFAFYDTDRNGKIGFDELLLGLATLNKREARHRWERIFDGYDIDEDGYVSRIDFLRMFKAHYALTKLMTQDLITAMEEAGVEYQTRDLVESAQPLSSAFAGSYPESQPRRTGEGKSANDFGDQIVFDGKGVLSMLESADTIAEDFIVSSAEAMNTQGPLAEDFNIRSAITDVYDAPWPSRYIEQSDVAQVLKHEPLIASITKGSEQDRVRHECHKRLVIQWRAYLNRASKVTKDRKKRAVFYDETSEENDDDQSKSQKHEEDPNSVRKRKARAEIFGILDAGKWPAFWKDLEDVVRAYEWPIDDVHEFCKRICVRFRDGMDSEELAKSVSYYARRTIEADCMGKDLYAMFNKYRVSSQAGDKDILDVDNQSKPAFVNIESRPPMSSSENKNDPINADTGVTSLMAGTLKQHETDTWSGAPDVSEPEEDIAREVLYQITKEAMNELLDPIFKLREDLYMDAQKTLKDREIHRSEIANAITEPQVVAGYLETFLRQQRVISEYPLGEKSDMSSDAEFFWQFIEGRDARAYTGLTSEHCADPKCNKLALIGQMCAACGLPTRQMVWKFLPDDMPAKMCESCAADGHMIDVSDDAECRICGRGPLERSKRVAELWHNISGNDDRLRSLQARQVISEEVNGREADSGGGSTSYDGTVTTVSDPFTQCGDDIGSADDKKGRISTKPNSVEATSRDAVGKEGTDAVGSEPEIEYPAMALDLHKSVRAFNEVDLTIEDEISARPVEVLLHEAGYGVVDDSNEALKTQTPARLEETEEVKYRDPTLPQNRPNTFSTIPSSQDQMANAQESKHIVESSEGQADPDTETNQSINPPKSQEIDKATLLTWAAYYIQEAKDKTRGGPGRISKSEFLEIIFGERGKGLQFLEEWMELATF